MSESTSLYRTPLSNCTVLESLDQAQTHLGQCAGFAFSANRFQLFSSIQQARRSDLSGVYECRFFNHAGELRWRMRPESLDDTGNGVLLTERSLEDNTRRLYHGLATGRQQYLLWGEAGKGDQPETELLNTHTPPLALPIHEIQAGQRVCIQSREYMGPASGSAGTQGNWVVLEERFLGFKVDGKGKRVKSDFNE